jgi:NADPH2:quinone reductase
MGKPEPALPFYPMMFKNLRLLWVFVYEMPAQAIDAAAHDINAWLETGTAIFPPFTRFPLERLADAHVAVEKAALGKVLVQCGADG